MRIESESVTREYRSNYSYLEQDDPAHNASGYRFVKWFCKPGVDKSQNCDLHHILSSDPNTPFFLTHLVK